MNTIRWFAPCIAILLCAGPLWSAPAPGPPTRLQCEFRTSPLGIDVPRPRLGWLYQSAERGARQTAYQVLVASAPELLAEDRGDLWDSGKVLSGQSMQIAYAGRPLESSRQAFWKVRYWGRDDLPSAWSASDSWTMGMLEPADWRAKWIASSAPEQPGSLLLRREFDVKPGLKRALVDICGLGQYELSLNGKRIGDDFLSPGWTNYKKTCLYDTRDITADLHPGRNAAGIELVEGMYRVLETRFRPPGWQPYSFGPMKVIAQIRLEYDDGTVETVGTDANWRTAPGAITSSSIYSGEDFDARLARKDWNRPEFDDSKWKPAKVTDGPGGALRGLSGAAPPIRLFEIHRPVSSKRIADGDVIFDLGQNAAHVPRITVTGPAGSRVRIIPSELGDGLISMGSMGEKPKNSIWCDFTKATDGPETWSPKFFYIGCRYLEVKSFPATEVAKLPEVKSIEGVVLHAAAESVGEFSCSSDLFNRIHALVRWAQRSNMMSVMTDCPQREKRGWLEEDHLNGPALRYNFGLATLFTKMLNDIADAQLANGLVPTTAPEYSIFRDKGQTGDQRGRFGDSPEWGSAFILVPWQQYEFDGDLELFRAHYDAMKNYVDYLGSRAKDGIVDYGLGDWYDIGPKRPGVAQLTPIALTATAIYFEDVRIMAKAAALLGKDDDARKYAMLADEIRAALNRKFFNAETNQYATGSQCSNAIPLVMGLAEPSTRPAVLANLVADVRAKGLTAGDVGYRYLLRALADGGRSDVIFEMNNQSEKPGYGMQLARGATSLTEAWDAAPGPSQNHFMLGQINEWLFHDLAGIQSDPSGPGFQKIVIKPAFVDGLTWVKTRYDSAMGPISSAWKRADGRISLEVEIPPNTTATVYLPAKDPTRVKEGGQPASRAPGVEVLPASDGDAVFRVGAGRYVFSAECSASPAPGNP